MTTLSCSSGQASSTAGETLKRPGKMSSSEAPAPGVFEIRDEVEESGRNLRAIREETDVPKVSHSSWFRCCFS